MLISIVLVALFVAVVLLLSKIAILTRSVQSLEWEVLKASRRLDHLEEENRPPQPAAEVKRTANLPQKESKEKQPDISTATQMNSQAETHRRIDAFVMPAPTPSRTREEWEAFIGGKILNRIGALALILGIGFFLKYAFDNAWLSESVRVGIGVVIGAVCLAGAYRTHTSGLAIFAQGLVGAGVAILYLSVFASFNFYSLVPQGWAFVLMSIVTVIAFANALGYNSLAVALLGLAGGFLTPILLSTGYPNETGLFMYLALLDAGLIAIAIRRQPWFIIEPLALAGTWVYFFAWYIEYYHPDDMTVTILFASVFWFLFIVPDLMRARSAGSVMNPTGQMTSAFNAVFYFTALFEMIDDHHHAWMGAATLVLAAFYAGTAWWISRRGLTGDRIRLRYTLTGIGLMGAATWIQFDDFPVVAWWSVEAAALVYAGTRWNMKYVFAAGIILCSMAVVAFIGVPNALAMPVEEGLSPFWNLRALALACIGISAGVSAWFARMRGTWPGQIIWAFEIVACAALFTLMTVEPNDAMRRLMDSVVAGAGSESRVQLLSFIRFMLLAVIWALLALPLVWTGVTKERPAVFWSGLVIVIAAVSMVAMRGIAFEPIELLNVILNVRTLGILVVMVTLFLHDRWLRSATGEEIPFRQLAGMIQVAAVVLVFVMLTGETRDYFRQEIVTLEAGNRPITEAVARLGNLLQLALSGIWLAYSVGLMAAGLWKHLRGLRVVAMVLFGITILKIFAYDLSFLETLYRIFSFIGLGIILIAVSYAYQRYKDIILSSPAPHSRRGE